MLKKISMVALLISVCTAASAFTIFNKPANTKLTKAVTAAEKNATKKDTANKSCSCDTAALEGKIKELRDNLDDMKKDYPDTGTIQKEMQAMKDDYNNQIKFINNNIESINKKLDEIQSHL